MSIKDKVLAVFLCLSPLVSYAESFAGIEFSSKTENLPKDFYLAEVNPGPGETQTYCYRPKADVVRVFSITTNRIRYCFAMNRMYMGEVAVLKNEDFKTLMSFMQGNYSKGVKIKGLPGIERVIWNWGDGEGFVASLEWDKNRDAGSLVVRSLDEEVEISELLKYVKNQRTQ